tara:strand:- start:241 stop:663 length:423 start_codon:yes stop_codon:yes gene_type:complete
MLFIFILTLLIVSLFKDFTLEGFDIDTMDLLNISSLKFNSGKNDNDVSNKINKLREKFEKNYFKSKHRPSNASEYFSNIYKKNVLNIHVPSNTDSTGPHIGYNYHNYMQFLKPQKMNNSKIISYRRLVKTDPIASNQYII